jgi:hypothetical protein
MVYLFLEGASFIKDDSGGDVGCFITSLSARVHYFLINTLKPVWNWTSSRSAFVL